MCSLRGGLWLLLLLVSGACRGRLPVHTSPDESRPQITWEIRSGGEFGDRQFVCGSAKPTAPCRLTASTPERRTLVLHLYLHGTAVQTNYVGAWRAPFLQGWTERDYRDVSGTVRPGDDPYHVSVSGIVTAKPGTYSFSVLLDGAQEGIPTGNRMVLDIPVTVADASGLLRREHARSPLLIERQHVVRRQIPLGDLHPGRAWRHARYGNPDDVRLFPQ